MEVLKVYEDEHLLAVNKPYGLIVHRKNLTDTQLALTDWVKTNYPEFKDVGEPFIASGTPLPRWGIVHRLDKDTSGLILIAKDPVAFDFLKQQFRSRTVHKHYYALVHGRPRETAGTIDAPLGRIGLKRTTELEGHKLIDGKEAITKYRTLRNFQKFTLLDVSPRTGRTHQVRVHLKSIGCPVAGDPVYTSLDWKPAGLGRLFLHAYKLELTAPDGKSLVLECDLPPELQNFLNMLK